MTTTEITQNVQRLNELFDQADKSLITQNEFIKLLKALIVPVIWVEAKLRQAYGDLDIWKICLLLDCIGQKSFGDGPETQPVTSLFCQIMEDPRIGGGEVEAIADAIGYFHLEKSALRSLVNICTSPRWDSEGWWPDLRKALESMLTVYRTGSCSSEELVAAYEEILNSPNTVHENRGIRDSIPGFIELARKPRAASSNPAPPAPSCNP